MLLQFVSFTCAFLVLINLVHCQNNKLETIEYDCTRQCDSHFSGEECWSKTLRFYSNELMKSMVQYKNIIEQTGKDENLLLKKTFDAVKKYVDQDSNLAQFVFSNPVNVTIDVVTQLIDKKPNGIRRDSKCPESCPDKPVMLWRSLYGLFMGLTLGTLLFLIGYTALLKLQYKKFNQKLTSASLNTS